MGVQRAARLCDVCRAGAGLGALRICGLRPHRGCTLAYRRHNHIGILALCVLRDDTVNVLLCDAPKNVPASAIRKLMREWGLLEWGRLHIQLEPDVALTHIAWRTRRVDVVDAP
jgi:hypothetical protein